MMKIIAVLRGYTQQEEDTYMERRSKLIVISNKDKAPIAEVSSVKGGANMVNSLERAKIEYVKKHIRLRKDGRYEFRVMKNGKITSYTDKDYTTVIQMALGKVRRIKRKNNDHIFYEYCKKFVELYRLKNKKEKTQIEYRLILDKYIKHYFNEKMFSKIKAEDLQRFINQIEGSRIRQKIYNFIKAVYTKAVAVGDVKRNIALAIELPYEIKKKKKRALLYEEQVKLLENLKDYDDDFQKFVIFSLVIGSRRSETCEFRLSDINEEKGLLHIRGTKTENAERTIKISNSMIKYLKQTNKQKDERYFKHEPDAYFNRLQRLYKKLGFENVDVHSLRRTCATNLYYLGISDKQRQQILGHASIVTTNDIYTFLEIDVKKENIEKLYKSLYFSEY